VLSNFFAIASSTINRFWKFYHYWKRQRIIRNNIFFSPVLKNLAVPSCETYTFKMLQLLYHSLVTKLSAPPFKFFLKFKETYYFTTYLLPCPAARVPVTSSRRWRTVGHLARPSVDSAIDGERVFAQCVWDKGGHFQFWQHANWVSGHWSSETMFQFVEYVFTSVNNSQRYHKSSAQLCHQELVEQLQHFKTSAFHTVVQRGFLKKKWRVILFCS